MYIDNMQRILNDIDILLLEEKMILSSMSGRIIVNENGIFALDQLVESDIRKTWKHTNEWVILCSQNNLSQTFEMSFNKNKHGKTL